jgi:uncharacterized membrane protein YcaP (DUF421 family)
MDLSLWSSLDQLLGTAARTGIVYVLTVVAVRLAGRRTLAQMSAFDTVITIGVGTLAASTALPTSPAVADFAAALLTFLALQVLIAAVRQRFPTTQRVLDFAPRVLADVDGTRLRRHPSAAQLTRQELESQLRQNGVGSLDDVELVVLEPSGRITVTPRGELPATFAAVTGRVSGL